MSSEVHQLSVLKKLGHGESIKTLFMEFLPRATSQFYASILLHLILCQHFKKCYFIAVLPPQMLMIYTQCLHLHTENHLHHVHIFTFQALS